MRGLVGLFGVLFRVPGVFVGLFRVLLGGQLIAGLVMHRSQMMVFRSFLMMVCRVHVMLRRFVLHKQISLSLLG